MYFLGLFYNLSYHGQVPRSSCLIERYIFEKSPTDIPSCGFFVFFCLGTTVQDDEDVGRCPRFPNPTEITFNTRLKR